MFEIFQALVERYGLDNISPLGVTMIKFKEPIATDLEGDGSTEMRETSLVDVMEIERELVIHCEFSGSSQGPWTHLQACLSLYIAQITGSATETSWLESDIGEACVVTNPGAIMLFNVPYPIRSIEDFSGACSVSHVPLPSLLLGLCLDVLSLSIFVY